MSEHASSSIWASSKKQDSLSRLVSEIAPPGAQCVCILGDVVWDPPFEESRLVDQAVASRRGEFLSARWAAHAALDLLGVDAPFIGRGRRGEPLWPAGVMGSITHSGILRASAVLGSEAGLGFGIDAELNEVLSFDVCQLIATESELGEISSRMARSPHIAWDRLTFSAKESIFKAQYPALGLELDFLDVSIQIHVDGRFEWVSRPTALRDVLLEGKWASSQGYLFTSALMRMTAGESCEN